MFPNKSYSQLIGFLNKKYRFFHCCSCKKSSGYRLELRKCMARVFVIALFEKHRLYAASIKKKNPGGT